MGDKRGVRNRARDAMWDYYLTNEQSRRENRRRQEDGKEKSKAERAEKVYAAVIIIGVIGCGMKYFMI